MIESPPLSPSKVQTRTYDRAGSVVFLKTNEPFGGLSNMAGGFPLCVNGTRILTSEALYQACRFPHRPEVQRLIIEQASPMTAKMRSKPYRHESRPDWDRVRVKIMRWCLRVKLAQNWDAFSRLLLETGDRPIVEQSRKDDFWGAKPVDEHTLIGMNVLGRLLMELREVVKAEDRELLLRVEPLAIRDFLLGGRPIEAVTAPVRVEVPVGYPTTSGAGRPAAAQTSLFQASEVREAPPPGYGRENAACGGIADLQPYPAMKKSGVPWLDEVPKHWEVRRLKYLLQERDDRSVDGSEQLLRVSQYTGVTQRKREGGGDEPDTRAESLVGYKRVEPNDLAVNIMLAWNGSMGASMFRGIVSPAYCVYGFGAAAHPWYFHYLLRSPVYKARIKAVSAGVVESRLRLYTDDLYRLEALLPPCSEQASIVRFLNHADRRIRRYIQAKQKLIKLLEEQKQTVIHGAVTRGLNPHARQKPSGVEWLGSIPEHWEVLALKRVLQNLIDCEHKTAPAVELSEYHVVRTSAVKNGGLRLEGTYCTTSEAYREWTRRGAPRPGDVIFTREAPAGEACVVPAGLSVCLGQRTVLMQIRPETYDPYFLVNMIYAGPPRHQIQLASQGSTVGHFNMDDIGWMHILKPPVAEQKEIVNWIAGATRSQDLAITRAEREISLLREYRTCLIADVITGKLDVREAAARLPEEAEEPESIAETEAFRGADEEAAEGLEETLVEAEA